MATNLDIPQELLATALELGGHTTKKAVVIAALEEYVRRLQQLRMLEVFGTVDFDPRYDYKEERTRGGRKGP